jgi:hypothetical protein
MVSQVLVTQDVMKRSHEGARDNQYEYSLQSGRNSPRLPRTAPAPERFSLTLPAIHALTGPGTVVPDGPHSQRICLRFSSPSPASALAEPRSQIVCHDSKILVFRKESDAWSGCETDFSVRALWANLQPRSCPSCSPRPATVSFCDSSPSSTAPIVPGGHRQLYDPSHSPTPPSPRPAAISCANRQPRSPPYQPRRPSLQRIVTHASCSFATSGVFHDGPAHGHRVWFRHAHPGKLLVYPCCGEYLFSPDPRLE